MIQRSFFFTILIAITHTSIFFIMPYWDGAITHYALAANRLEIIKVAASEIGRPLEYLFWSKISTLSTYLGISNILFIDCLTILLIGFMIICIYTISQQLFKLNKSEATIISLLICLNPYIYSITNAVLMIYFLYYTLFLIAWICFCSNKKWAKLLSFPLVFISFFYNSLLMIHLAFCVIYKLRKQIKKHVATLNFLIFGSLPFLFWGLKQWKFKPYGNYSGYNSMLLPTSLDNIYTITQNMLKTIIAVPLRIFLDPWLREPLFTTSIYLTLLVFILFLFFRYKAQFLDFFDFQYTKSKDIYVVLGLLFLSAMIPYAITNNVPYSSVSTADRHVILLIFPISMLLWVVISRLKVYKVRLFICILILTQLITTLIFSYAVLLVKQELTELMIAKAQKSYSHLDSALIDVNISVDINDHIFYFLAPIIGEDKLKIYYQADLRYGSLYHQYTKFKSIPFYFFNKGAFQSSGFLRKYVYSNRFDQLQPYSLLIEKKYSQTLFFDLLKSNFKRSCNLKSL